MTAPRARPEAAAHLERLRTLAGLVAAERSAGVASRFNALVGDHINPAAAGAAAVAQPAAAAVLGPPYSVLVHVYSHLKLRAELLQDDYEPGARVGIVARLSRVGMPFDGAATLFAEVTPPGGLPLDVALEKRADGNWEGAFTALQVGVHKVRVRAVGRNVRNQKFTRELTLSAGIVRGGNTYVPPSNPNGGDKDPCCDKQTCATWLCMLENGLFSKRLEEALNRIGINLDVARKCLHKYCAEHGGGREMDVLLRTLQDALQVNQTSERGQ
jgi:hypothetical protein